MDDVALEKNYQERLEERIISYIAESQSIPLAVMVQNLEKLDMINMVQLFLVELYRNIFQGFLCIRGNIV